MIKNILLAQNNPIGEIKGPLPNLPSGVNSATGELTGIVILMNTVLRVIFIIAGVWALFNIIIAGINFINAGGDPKKVAQAWEKIWMSFIGLLIIVSSFLIAAIFGIILFGDPGAILNPKLAPVQ